MSSRRSSRSSTVKSGEISAARARLATCLSDTRRQHRIYASQPRYLPVKDRWTSEGVELRKSSAQTLDALAALIYLTRGEEAVLAHYDSLVSRNSRKAIANPHYEWVHAWMELEAPTLRDSSGKFICGTRYNYTI